MRKEGLILNHLTENSSVDAAAKKAGYTIGPVWHGSKVEGITKFNSGGLTWFSTSKEFTDAWGSNKYRVYLKIKNPRIYTDSGMHLAGLDTKSGIRSELSKGHDGIIVENPAQPSLPTNYAVRSPSQIKSAEVITYDDEGKAIPLEKRFDSSNPDMRY